MRDRIFIQNDVLVFLYAFFRQIDLSLDRSRWTNWSELVDYYREKISASSVHKLIEEIKDGDFLTDPGLFKKLILPKYFLTGIELIKCIDVLLKFEDLLDKDLSEYNSDCENLRIDVVKICTQVFEPRIGRDKFDKATRVEHFNQSNNLKVIPIEDFIKNFNLAQ